MQRGLLSKLRTSVARRRIQAWTLQESFLQRLLERRSLRIDTAVAEQQGQGDQRALKELAPIAPPEACDALIQHLLPQAQWPRQQWTSLPGKTWWRLFLPSALFFVLLALAPVSYTHLDVYKRQHLDLKRGPLERAFGLATLVIHTAGTRMAAVSVSGLRGEDAERLRDRLARQLDLSLIHI